MSKPQGFDRFSKLSKSIKAQRKRYTNKPHIKNNNPQQNHLS